MVPGKPIFIMSWIGLEPQLPSILMNSHTDGVPVFPERWKYDALRLSKKKMVRPLELRRRRSFCCNGALFFTQGTFMVEELKT